MTLYTLDYNEVSKTQTILWQKFSRNNLYKFNTKDGLVDATDIIKYVNATSVLDYGCGFGHSLDSISNIVTVQKYDPFVPEFTTRPTGKYDLVVAYNVLSCVETICFDDVIDDLYQLTGKLLLLNIPCSGFYNRDKDWYLNYFNDSIKFKLKTSNYTEETVISTRINSNTKKVISSASFEQNYLFILLQTTN
tara:strand:+ start:88 stop:663 length:576 start_codon:yes stop_codon:yes gene_type:complete